MSSKMCLVILVIFVRGNYEDAPFVLPKMQIIHLCMEYLF